MAREGEREEELELVFDAHEDGEPYGLEAGDGFGCDELLPELLLSPGAQTPSRLPASEAPRGGCEPAWYNRERKSSREKQRRHELNVNFAALARAIGSNPKTERADLLQSAMERIDKLENENRRLKAQLLNPLHAQPAVAADAALAPGPRRAAAPGLAPGADAHEPALASAGVALAHELELRKRKRSPSPGDGAPPAAQAKALAGHLEHACADAHELAVLQQLQGLSALQGLMCSPSGQLMLHPAAMLAALVQMQQMQQMQTALAQSHVAAFPAAPPRPPSAQEEDDQITHSHCA
jgi:hypothetical protein